MAAIMPPLYIDPPTPGPVRPGLFTAARGPLDLPEHARTGGIEFEPDTCGEARLYSAECPITAQDLKTFDPGDGVMTAEPYVVYAGTVCTPVGRPAAEQQRRVLARLMAGEQTAVERALWDGGSVGAEPALTTVGAATVTTTVTGFAGRVGALEAAFYAASGYQGTIHVNMSAADVAAQARVIERDGAQLRTPYGSVWSFGAGYDITGPDDAAPDAGSVWAFITPPVTIWRSTEILTPDPAQTFDRKTNQMYAIAEREYLHAINCDSAYAIQLPLDGSAS